ncbi:MAG: hypothetical protein LBL32_03190 [Holosporales bacterium]|jgi:hypothetical protein|nr:hypothetical protein [Holosporales bacterium]
MNSPSTVLVDRSWFVVDVFSLVTVDVLLETTEVARPEPVYTFCVKGLEVVLKRWVIGFVRAGILWAFILLWVISFML